MKFEIRRSKPSLIVIIIWLTAILEIAAQPKLVNSRYIGGLGNDESVGVAIVGNSVIVAGNFPDLKESTLYNSINLLTANSQSKGKVLVYSAITGVLLTEINIGEEIYDFSLQNEFSSIAVVSGNFGMVQLNISNNSLQWHIPMSSKISKVRINDKGNILALSSNTLLLYNPQGVLLSKGIASFDQINDIAILGDKVFVTGFQYEVNLSEASYCSVYPTLPKNLQVAFLMSYKYTGQGYMVPADTTWGFKGNDLNCDIASTRGVKLHAAANGSLYFLGETINSENVFRYNGKTNYKLNNFSLPDATSLSVDIYNNIESVAANIVITYYAKIDTLNGQVIQGQFIMSRNDSLGSLQNNTPYRISEGFLTTDPFGKIYIGGMAGQNIEYRNNNRYSALEVAPYAGGDPALLISNNFYSRVLWQAFTGPGGKGSINGIGISQNYLAVTGKVEKGAFATFPDKSIQPFNPEDFEVDNLNDTYLAIYTNPQSITMVPNNASKYTPDVPIEGGGITDEFKTVEVYDLQGRSFTATDKKLDIRNLPAGIYIIRVTTNSKVEIKKILVQ